MSSSSPQLRTVDRVDLDRYMGRWHVISHIPNFLENGKTATSDNYARLPDGKLQADFAFRKGSLDAPEQKWKGVAWVTNSSTNAEWKVQLFWPFTADYQILELAPDYSWAVVSSRGGKWLWVLARATSLPEPTYRDILDRVARRGFDPAELELVPQQPGT